jgi:hypothetical protein
MSETRKRERRLKKAIKQLKRIIWNIRYRFFMEEERLQSIREDILLVLCDELKIMQDKYEIGQY